MSLLLSGTIVAAGARAWGADETPAGQPGDAASGGELQLPATPEKGIVRLTIKTDNPQVQLKRKVARITSGSTGLLVEELICRTPCGAVIDGRKGEEFYFGGKDYLASDPFQIIDHSGNLEATVKEGSYVAYSLGSGFLVIGILGIVLGGIFATTGEVKWGLIGAGASAALTLGAWVLYTKAGKTTVEFRPGPAN